MRKRLLHLTILQFLSIGIVALSFIIPISFAGIRNGLSCKIWLYLSESGGIIGSSVAGFLLCILIGIHFKKWWRKILASIAALLFFGIALIGVAKVNEHVIKERLRIERPYALFLNVNYGLNLDDFYALENKDLRTEYLTGFINEKLSSTGLNWNEMSISPEILDHWLIETGFSFPSGHSVISFLIATFFSYIIMLLYNKDWRKYLSILPCLWAIFVALSRAAVGAHSSLDITIGAIIGVLFGIGIIGTTLIDRLIKLR